MWNNPECPTVRRRWHLTRHFLRFGTKYVVRSTLKHQIVAARLLFIGENEDMFKAKDKNTVLIDRG